MKEAMIALVKRGLLSRFVWYFVHSQTCMGTRDVLVVATAAAVARVRLSRRRGTIAKGRAERTRVEYIIVYETVGT